MYALIFQNKIIQIEAEPFPVTPNLIWVEITGNEKVGYSYADGKFKAPEDKLRPEPKELRAAEHLPIEDRLDALMKQMERMRADGQALVPEMDAALDHWDRVNKKYPKAEK